MNNFKVHIITPDESFVDKEVSFAGFQAQSGRITVLANHQPMICSLKEGDTVFHTTAGTEHWTTGKGFLKVERDQVLVLTHYAELNQ